MMVLIVNMLASHVDYDDLHPNHHIVVLFS